jgi:BirA family biotin operon repressor/biotin-[acetyl-CoA-carboxylase] ligase
MDLAQLLAAIAEGGANGAQLAEHFGVSRTMVWKGMQVLRNEGLVIEGEAGHGYTLVSDAGFGRHTLSWRLGRDVTFFDTCGSTNAEARQLAGLAEDPSGALVVANTQTAGRGRLGRQWESSANENLLFSLVLCPEVPPQLAPVCVLSWAAAMAEVLDCQVKWPNDLITSEGQKLGGILAELSAEAERVRFVVLGVGINVNQLDFPGLPLATSLARETGELRDRARLLAQLVEAIEAVPTQGQPDLSAWRARSHTLGRRVRIGDVEGIATDVREDGALLVDGRAVLAGDVSLVSE